MNQETENKKAALESKCEQLMQYAQDLGLNFVALAVLHEGTGAAAVHIKKNSLEQLDQFENTIKRMLNEVSKVHLKALLEVAAKALEEDQEDDE